MTLIKTTLSAAVVACGLAAGMLGSGSPPASAQPAPPAPVQGEQPPAWAPPKAAEFQGEQPPAWTPPKAAEFWSEPPPAWAPPKPAEFWNGQPVVWNSAWGGRWGVWINGGFIILTSNPVTGGG